MENRRHHLKPVLNPILNSSRYFFVVFFLSISLFLSTAWAVVEETPFAVVEEPLDLAIPDAGEGSLSHTIFIPGNDLIQDIEISFKINHPAAEQLHIILITPDGLINLHDHTPFAENPFSPIYEITDASVDPLNVLTGVRAKGNWTLSITDTVPGDTGRLLGWGIKMRPVSVLTAPPPTPLPIPTPAFTEKSRLPLDLKISSGIAEDLNNDNIQDLLLLTKTNNSFLVIHSNGSTFNEEVKRYEVDQPQKIAVGDLNNDQRKDIVVASSNGSQSVFTAFIADGSEEYNKGFAAAVTTGLDTLAILDINQDGIKDVVLGGEPYYALGVGDGSFEPAQPLLPNHLGKAFWAYGDLNHDGLPDLLVAISRGGTSSNADPYIIWGGSKLESLQKEKLTIKGKCSQAFLSVSSRPGDLRLAIIADSGEFDPTWWFNTISWNSYGQFLTEQVRLAGDLFSLPLYPQDINGDGVDEMLFTNDSGVMAFQRTDDNFGGRSTNIYPITAPLAIIPGYYFPDHTAGLAVLSQMNELLLLQSTMGVIPTPTPYMTPTQTPAPFLFIPTQTPTQPVLVPSTPTPISIKVNDPDLNGDGIVNQQDLLLLMQFWGTTGKK